MDKWFSFGWKFLGESLEDNDYDLLEERKYVVNLEAPIYKSTTSGQYKPRLLLLRNLQIIETRKRSSSKREQNKKLGKKKYYLVLPAPFLRLRSHWSISTVWTKAD